MISLPAYFSDALLIEGQTYTGTPKQAGIDNHAHCPDPNDGPVIYRKCVFDANGASEALKLPRKYDFAFLNCHIVGGVEDGVDIVRGGNLWFVECTFERGQAKQDVTIKGGAHDVHIIACDGLRLIEVGNYTKYDAHATYPDGTTRRALPWRCARPPVRGLSVEGCPGCEVIEYHSEPTIGDVSRPLLNRRRIIAAPFFYVRSTFFSEINPAPAEEFTIKPEELA
ncbi:MAG: hypothetical protein WC378_00875 [Opitutaceae bacterium]|jgi:hypothetical protein